MEILILAIINALFLSYSAIIYHNHKKFRDAVKIRIHVNGTRGKSSVTRLIAAGFRAGGIRTLAKVTGTAVKIIYPDASEKALPRIAGKGNIIEQIFVFKEAVRKKAEAVIIECMALRPNLQKISEEKLVRSTLGIITNIKPDHLDVMGPAIEDVGNAILNTVPRNAVLITAEREFFDIISQKAAANGTQVLPQPQPEKITNEMMSGFKYLEHRGNVALALATCEYYGINRDTALKGMHQAVPDPGVLRTFKIHRDNKYIEFINALATNDPFSLMVIWQRMLKKIAENQLKIIFLNSRRDRYSRSQQLVELIAQELPTDYCILAGEATAHVARSLSKNGLSQKKIINMGITTPELIFNKVLALTQGNSVVFAIGNITDRFNLGMGTAEYFREGGRQE